MPFKGVYFIGNEDGTIVKIGKAEHGLAQRLHQLRRESSRGRLVPGEWHLLAAVLSHAPGQAESALKGHFGDFLVKKPGNKEEFHAEPQLVEYVNWLRQQWVTWTDEEEGPDDTPDYGVWQPEQGRLVTRRSPEPDALVQLYDAEPGPLANTCWADMAIPKPRLNDYYTPPDLIDAARRAMGGIDLDAASSWSANAVHKIPKYFHIARSAKYEDWHGRVWLNPPYGDNKMWFGLIADQYDKGNVKQLCLLSPAWPFVAKTIAPLVTSRASAFALLTPTPTFWGRERDQPAKGGNPARKGKECKADNPVLGVDHPHVIVYIGPRVREFRDAFADRALILPTWDYLEKVEASRVTAA